MSITVTIQKCTIYFPWVVMSKILKMILEIAKRSLLPINDVFSLLSALEDMTCVSLVDDAFLHITHVKSVFCFAFRAEAERTETQLLITEMMPMKVPSWIQVIPE